MSRRIVGIVSEELKAGRQVGVTVCAIKYVLPVAAPPRRRRYISCQLKKLEHS